MTLRKLLLMAEGSWRRTSELLAMIHNTGYGRAPEDVKQATDFNPYAPAAPKAESIELPIQALKLFTQIPLR